jgi:hypothetical protein
MRFSVGAVNARTGNFIHFDDQAGAHRPVVQHGRAEKSESRYPPLPQIPLPQIVPLSIRPYLRNTSCPARTLSPVKTRQPASSTARSGMGGAF